MEVEVEIEVEVEVEVEIEVVVEIEIVVEVEVEVEEGSARQGCKDQDACIFKWRIFIIIIIIIGYHSIIDS